MRTTATQLVTFWTCPFLWHVSYEVRQPLPVWGTRRRFGTVIHAAIAAYERHGRSLEHALWTLEEARSGLTLPDLEEAKAILRWRHERGRGREGRLVLVEGTMRAHLGEHRLEVRMDRLDSVGGDYLLAEYKGGKSVDLDLVRVQLMILSFAIFDVFGRPPDRWEVELLRGRKVLELPAERNPEVLRGFVADQVRRLLEGDREPRPYNPQFCRRCPARPFCPKMSPNPRELASRVPSETSQLTLF